MLLTLLNKAPVTPRRILSKLPVLAAKGVSLVPFTVQRSVMVKVLEQMFKEAIIDGDFEFLETKCFQVKINDADLSWYFRSANGEIIVNRVDDADACISGNLKEFLLLASRREDPDTLFFQRRLMIEGNTEVGLEIKNVMDEIDLDALPSFVRSALEKLTDVVCSLQDLKDVNLEGLEPKQEKVKQEFA